jgi:phosphoadenosine phosphosulfate reductase
MLGQLNFDYKDKVEVALDRIKYFEPDEGYYLAFSGGKDSIVCYELLKLAGVKFDVHYNNTTVDPPDLIYFIRNNYPEVIIHNPNKTMWELIEYKLMPPTRLVRYCCSELKENSGNGRFVVTGVRWQESTKRSKRKSVEYDVYGSKSKKANEIRKAFYTMNDNSNKRRMIENCQIKGKNILNPIIDWTDFEVWEFIRKYKLKYCKLYDEGWKRIGCVGCPMSGKHRIEEFKKYPKIKDNYIRAFERMLIQRKLKGLPTKWIDGQQVMDWWLSQ